MIEGLHIHDWIAYKRRIEGFQLIVEHPLCEARPRGWLVSGEQIPNRISMREVTKKARCDNKEFLLQYQSFKRARTVVLAYQCSKTWLTSHLFFIPTTGLSLKTTSFPSVLPITLEFCRLLPLSLPQCKLLVCLMFVSKWTTLTQTITVTEPILQYSHFQSRSGSCLPLQKLHDASALPAFRRLSLGRHP